MKKIISKSQLVLAIFIVTSSLSFSQDKFGGLTLYTVRNEMKSNSEETLKAVADVGYKYIEAADYKYGKFYNMTPEEFKNQVTDLGMKPLDAIKISHEGLKKLGFN